MRPECHPRGAESVRLKKDGGAFNAASALLPMQEIERNVFTFRESFNRLPIKHLNALRSSRHPQREFTSGEILLRTSVVVQGSLACRVTHATSL